MGLPQLSSKIDDEAATSPRTSVQSTAHFGGVSSCDLHGLHFTSTYNGSSLAGDFPCSSIGDFQRKTTLEVPTGLEGPFGAEGMKSGSNEKNLWLVSKAKRNVQDPVSRIVGFESSGTSSFINGFERLSTDRGNTSSNIGVSDNLVDVHGLQVRKRLLSPLNGMLSPRQFNGDHLDLNNIFTNSGVPVGNERVFKIQGKKANIGKNGYIDAPIWSSTRCLGWSEPAADNGSNPFLFTDGPLLDNQDPCDTCLVSRGIDFCRDRSKVSTFTRAVTVSPEKVNSPLSLSPLGPRWSERMKNAEYFRVAVKDGEHCISKNMGVLLDESAPRISHSPNADERGISASNCQDIGMLGSDIEKLTPQSCPETGSKWGPESIPLPQCVKLVRSLSGASARRSLVGSFEESLLSGRFSSGKANQRIDGFLAVLNVTGGNFIPPSQKLPFSVTSIDGDSCLLYYASIDLAGNLPSNKGRGKLKRSLSNDESRSAKSRLRVPMKGRIQLVLSNPEKTPLHTFLCSYDLSDMPAGTKTFMRQKVNLASCSSTLDPMEREKITDVKNGRTPTMAPDRSHPTQLNNEFTESNQGNILYSMRPMQQDAKVKNDGSDILGFVYDDDSQQYDDHLEKQNVGGFPLCFPSEDHLEKQNGFNRKAVDDINKGECRKSEGKSISLNACHSLNKKLVGSSLKVNENSAGAGALRYALHLRFLCPSAKKSSRSMQRCKSDPFAAPHTNTSDDERRFYLYNDLRVVFPQRHSDADEGKLIVEQHFPADPKYFDISN